jgi:flagellin
MERLSSGKRINSAMDDAAGLSITHQLDSQILGLNQAARNANDGISMLQTAEGALEEVSNILNRMKELAVQASSDTYSAVDRDAMDLEYQALHAEITRISDETTFNGQAVVGGTTNVDIQIGHALDDSVNIVFQDMAAASLGTTSGAGATTNVTFSAITSHTTGAAAVNQLATINFTDANLTADTESITVTIAGTTYTQGYVTDGASTPDHMDATLTALAGQIIADKANSGFDTVEVATGTDTDTTDMILTATAQSATQISVGTASIISSTAASASGAISGQDLQDQANSEATITVVDNAILMVDAYRTTLGATANRLEFAVSNIMSRVENHSATRSRIEDADFAVESANLAKSQVLQQAGTAMLAQANASGQGVLSLLK